MYFGTKSYLKSNRYHTAKHTLKLGPSILIYNIMHPYQKNSFLFQESIYFCISKIFF